MNIEDKYHEPILALIKEKGKALGVSEIAPAIGMATTSVHKYLNRQGYFRQNSNKKWDLPENITEVVTQSIDDTRIQLLAQSLTTQAMLVGNSLDLFTNGVSDLLRQIETIIPTLQKYKPPVAREKSPVIPQSVVHLMEGAKKLTTVIKERKKDLAEYNQELLIDVNWLELMLDIGKERFEKEIWGEISELIVTDRDSLSVETVNLIERYKK